MKLNIAIFPGLDLAKFSNDDSPQMNLFTDTITIDIPNQSMLLDLIMDMRTRYIETFGHPPKAVMIPLTSFLALEIDLKNRYYSYDHNEANLFKIAGVEILPNVENVVQVVPEASDVARFIYMRNVQEEF